MATIKDHSFEKSNKKKVDVLLITSLININHLNRKDYIFFDLENKLKKRKLVIIKFLLITQLILKKNFKRNKN